MTETGCPALSQPVGRFGEVETLWSAEEWEPVEAGRMPTLRAPATTEAERVAGMEVEVVRSSKRRKSVSARIVDGFAAMLLITADPDWEAKWATPYSEAPQFSAAQSVATGGELALLFFFHNPQRGPGDAVDIRCDLKVTRPDVTGDFNQASRLHFGDGTRNRFLADAEGG